MSAEETQVVPSAAAAHADIARLADLNHLLTGVLSGLSHGLQEVRGELRVVREHLSGSAHQGGLSESMGSKATELSVVTTSTTYSSSEVALERVRGPPEDRREWKALAGPAEALGLEGGPAGGGEERRRIELLEAASLRAGAELEAVSRRCAGLELKLKTLERGGRPSKKLDALVAGAGAGAGVKAKAETAALAVEPAPPSEQALPPPDAPPTDTPIQGTDGPIDCADGPIEGPIAGADGPIQGPPVEGPPSVELHSIEPHSIEPHSIELHSVEPPSEHAVEDALACDDALAVAGAAQGWDDCEEVVPETREEPFRSAAVSGPASERHDEAPGLPAQSSSSLPVPGDPPSVSRLPSRRQQLTRELTRVLELEEEEEEEEEEDELVRVTAALLSRLVALEARVEAAERGAGEAREGERALAAQVGRQVARLEGAVETLQQQREEQREAPSAPLVGVAQGRRHREETDPSQLLGRVRAAWTRVCTELGQALHAFPKHSKWFAEQEGRGEGATLVQRLEGLRADMDALVHRMSPADEQEVAPLALLALVHGPLDRLTAELEDVLAQDRRLAASLTPAQSELTVLLADVCYRDKELPLRMQAAVALSMPLLDVPLEKIRLQRRVEALEAELGLVARRSEMAAAEDALREALAGKAGRKEVEAQLGKKAALAEVWRFRESVFKQVESLRAAVRHGGALAEPSGSEQEHASFAEEAGEVQGVEGAASLGRRFESLNDQFGRLMEVLDTLVARRELEEALLRVMGEVRALRERVVDPSQLRERLREKASAEDLRRLVSALELALGGKLDEIGEAAAVRCLVCDKPATSVSRGAAGGAYYEKDGRRTPKPIQISDSVDSTLDRRRGDELAVLTYTLELPQLPGSAAYKRRVRASAGGGAGPILTPDSR